MIRTFIGHHIVAPVIARTGFRFSKAYRHGVTRFHQVVYAIVSTPAANIRADEIAGITPWHRAWLDNAE